MINNLVLSNIKTLVRDIKHFTVAFTKDAKKNLDESLRVVEEDLKKVNMRQGRVCNCCGASIGKKDYLIDIIGQTYLKFVNASNKFGPDSEAALMYKRTLDKITKKE